MTKCFRGLLMLSALFFLGGCGHTHHKVASPTHVQTAPTAFLFTAKMDGSQEVPSVNTTASGTGLFQLNAEKTELTFDVTVTGLSGPVISAHIHRGVVGASGPPVLSLMFTGDRVSGVWKSTDAYPLTPEIVSGLEAGDLYVNAHTDANPKGEIRGQLISTP